MKRLGIFFFYEKNGDVDDFITYYLADLAKNLTDHAGCADDTNPFFFHSKTCFLS